MMRAMSSMMHGDILCPEADNVFLVGSDCLATEAFTPRMYLNGKGQPIVLTEFGGIGANSTWATLKVTSTAVATLFSSGASTRFNLTDLVITNAGTTSERILRKMNDEKKMNMNVISGKDYGESFLTLQSGRVQGFMMDDVLLAGARTLAQKPTDWVVTGTPQSFEAYGFMLRKDDPAFKKLVDATLAGMMKSGEFEKLYKKWFQSPIPPRGISLDMTMGQRLRENLKSPSDQPAS